jgi:hypothetical protein
MLGAEIVELGFVSVAVRSSVRFCESRRAEGETVGRERWAWLCSQVKAVEIESTLEPSRHCGETP